MILRWRKALADGDDNAAVSLRRLTESLAVLASTYALPEIEPSARAVAHAHLSRALPERVDELIALIRKEMHPPESNQHIAKLSARGASARSRSILVASGDRRLVDICVDLAYEGAHRVETFSVVNTARAYVVRNRPGIIVLDADLPDDPLSWLVDLRASAEGADIPVLVIATSSELHLDALVLGASEFHCKSDAEMPLEHAFASYLGIESRTIVELALDPATNLPGAGLFQEAVADQVIGHQGRMWCAALVCWRNRRATADNQALAMVAARAIADGLREKFPEPSFVARLDQDTFAVLIPDIDIEQITSLLEQTTESLVATAPSMLDLGVGAVLSLEGDYSTVLATARRMQDLASIAGQRVLLTTLDESLQEKILLVAENAEVASVLRTALDGLPFDIVFRRTALEALETASAVPFQLVLVSASLPNHAAFDLLSTLREWPSYVECSLITLVTNDSERVRAYESGASECLTFPSQTGGKEPFNPDVLRACLHARLIGS